MSSSRVKKKGEGAQRVPIGPTNERGGASMDGPIGAPGDRKDQLERNCFPGTWKTLQREFHRLGKTRKRGQGTWEGGGGKKVQNGKLIPF